MERKLTLKIYECVKRFKLPPYYQTSNIFRRTDILDRDGKSHIHNAGFLLNRPYTIKCSNLTIETYIKYYFLLLSNVKIYYSLDNRIIYITLEMSIIKKRHKYSQRQNSSITRLKKKMN